MSLTKCQKAVFDKHGIDAADREFLSAEIDRTLEIGGMNLEQATTSSGGAKLLRMAVGQALVEAKLDRNEVLAAIKAQHPAVFGGTPQATPQAAPQATPQATPQAPKAKKAKKAKRAADYGEKNTLVTKDEAEKLRAELRASMGRLNAGIDPELLFKGMKLGVYHLEAGSRAFADWAETMLDDLGATFRPFLKSWYEAARAWPGFDNSGMTSTEVVSKFDLDSIELDEEGDNAESPGRPVESDSVGADAVDTVGRNDVPPVAGRPSGEPAGRGSEPAEGPDTGNRDSRVPDGTAPAAGTGSPGSVPAGTPRVPGLSDAGRNSGRGPVAGREGVLAGRDGAESPESVARRNRERADASVATATSVVEGDLDNIRATVPQLLPGQDTDVQFAENRLFKNGGRGVLFTNGTGTGKTFVGAGLIKRMLLRGKDNILITAPSQEVIDGWVKAARTLGFELTPLTNTRDAGTGPVITTLANFYQNNSLAKRTFDLIVHDESHMLAQNKGGGSTVFLDMSRALTGHALGAYRYTEAMEPELVAEIEQLSEEYKKALAARDYNTADPIWRRLEAARGAFQKKLEEHKANRQELWDAKTTNVLYLSATPFAWERAIPYAEGFLFDFPPENQKTVGSWRHSSPRDEFFIKHLGWKRDRKGRAVEPDKEVDRGILQRAFNNFLRKAGALSMRLLQIDHDYSRDFVAVDDLIGTQIDLGINYLRDRALNRADPLQEGFSHLLSEFLENWTFHERVRILEAIKAKHAVERIKKHLALGRKVVVYHSRIKGTNTNPFAFAPWDDGSNDVAAARNQAIQLFRKAFPTLAPGGALNGLQGPLAALTEAFGDRVAFLNGTQAKGPRRAALRDFNLDNSGVDVLAVQEDAGGAGINLHDTTGKHPRVLINLGLPYKPTLVSQIEGRVYRIGQKSNAIFEYFNTGTSFERLIFAERIAERTEAVENLSFGDAGRALRAAIVDAYENPSSEDPSDKQGTGQRDADRRVELTITPFDAAKTFYYANTKLTGKRNQREGIDYFPTPEPIGLKMVEWAGIMPGEAALEPSAGHGAVARFFPENSDNTFVEQSEELASYIGLRAKGKLRVGDFMALDAGANKYDAIVMNPPYGVGGKTAIEHLEKAAKHLRDGGRIVALLPSGPMADKRLEAWLYSEDKDSAAKGLHLVADFGLPGVTFERAGTKIASHIIVLEKAVDPRQAAKIQQQSRRDFGAETIKELFDQIETVGVPDRLKRRAIEEAKAPAPAPAATPASESTDPIERARLTVAPIKAWGKDAWIVGGNTYAYKDQLRLLGGKWNGSLKGWQFETDPTDLLREQLSSGTDTRLRRNPRTGNGLAASAVTAVVDRIRANWRNAPPVIVVQSYLDLPAAIREAAEAQGALPGEVDGVYHKGSVYLVSDNLGGRVDIERALFHEVYGHFGLRTLLGADGGRIQARLNELYLKIGGLKGLRALAARRGIDLTDYIEGTRQLSAEIRNALLMEELVAHLAEQSETLQSRIRAVFGAIRQWLKAHGFMELAKWNDADLANLVRQARRAVTEGRYTQGRGQTASINEDSGEYQADLFGNPLPGPRRPSRRGSTPERDVQSVSVLREAPDTPGVYGVVTRLISERQRDIPVTTVRSIEDAAEALAYLGDSAVEHFDALVVDDKGKPLAIVGSFKGTVDGASVPGEVVAREAFMVRGAARIWMAHNHPSGNADQSLADIELTRRMTRIFRGTGLEVAGMFAFGNQGGKRFYEFRTPDVFETQGNPPIRGFAPVNKTVKARVPIAERVFEKTERLGTSIFSPTSATDAAVRIAGRNPGLLLLDTRHYPTAFIPVEPGNVGVMRGSGLPASLWRAISKANAAAAIIVSPGGALSEVELGNLGGFVAESGARLLDVIEYHPDTGNALPGATTTSRAELGTTPSKQTYLRVRFVRTVAQLTDEARKGEAMKDWYDEHQALVEELFGEDAGLFQKILSATSQLQTVAGNVTMALRAYRAFKLGEPITWGLPAVRMNLERIRSGLGLRGQKIGEFGEANEGSDDAMAVDRHVAELLFNTKAPTAAQVEAAKRRIRQIASVLGWTPRQAQAAIWAANQMRPRRRGGKAKAIHEINTYAKELRARRDAVRELLSSLPGGNGGGLRAGRYPDGGAGENLDAGIRFARRRPSGNRDLDEAFEMASLAGKASLASRIRAYLAGGWSQVRGDLTDLGDRIREGLFDKFDAIKANEARLLGGLPAELSGYVAARLSTGLASVMRGILLDGAPEWRNGVISKKAGSKGLLDVLAPVENELEDWLLWMVGRRAERLMSVGKENLFEARHIAAMKTLAGPAGGAKEQRFQQVADDFADFKRSILDLAEAAGLIDATTRPMWDLADWIPFYRAMESNPDQVKGPRNRKGLAWQSSGIRQLRGGTSNINDPMENIVMNFAHLVDASLKNHAIDQVRQNFDNLGIFEKLTPKERMGKALVPLSEVKRHLKNNGVATAGIPNAVFQGIAQMWAFQAPTDPNVVRIMEGGKAVYYRVTDRALLRALTSVNEEAVGGVLMAGGRFFRRLLTGGVTADPAFIARNFIRDMVHAWVINPDGFRLGVDSVRGLHKTLSETGGGIDMLFGGASFMGGYLNANDPQEVARAIRRSLRARGMSASAISRHMATVIDTPVRLWEMYRHFGDAVENASREAVYEAALKAGKSRAQAIFEAKDLMDYSMRGQWTAVRVLTDVVPFMNARLQGLYKLGRSGALVGPGMKARLVAKGMLISLATLLLMLVNRDRPEYEELEDWDKDTYWHFWAGKQHYRLPKPFEVGLIYGTVPERLFRYFTGRDDNEKAVARLFANLGDTLNFDPMPQAIKPAVEAGYNRNSFTGRPIENMGDERKLPSARYNENTSDTARLFADLVGDEVGIGPKKIEHLVRGYLGTLGAYALGVSDMVVRKAQGKELIPAEMRPDEIPVVSAFVRGEGPARSTVYQTEFYELLKEVNDLYGTVQKYKGEGREDDAEALLDKHDEKLSSRKYLNKVSTRLSTIRKSMDAIYRDDTMSRAERRAALDELMAERNELTREAVLSLRSDQ